MRLICGDPSKPIAIKPIAMIRLFAEQFTILPSELRNWHRTSLAVPALIEGCLQVSDIKPVRKVIDISTVQESYVGDSAIRKTSPNPQRSGTAFQISELSTSAGVWLCPCFVIAAQQFQFISRLNEFANAHVGFKMQMRNKSIGLQIQLGLRTAVSNLERCAASRTNYILEVARAQHASLCLAGRPREAFSLGRFQLNLRRFGRRFPVCIDPSSDLADQYGNSDWQFCVLEEFRCEALDFH